MDQKSYIGSTAQVADRMNVSEHLNWPYKVSHQSGLSNSFPVDVPMTYLVASGRAPGYILPYVSLPTETFEKEWEIVEK